MTVAISSSSARWHLSNFVRGALNLPKLRYSAFYNLIRPPHDNQATRRKWVYSDFLDQYKDYYSSAAYFLRARLADWTHVSHYFTILPEFCFVTEKEQHSGLNSHGWGNCQAGRNRAYKGKPRRSSTCQVAFKFARLRCQTTVTKQEILLNRLALYSDPFNLHRAARLIWDSV